MRINAKIVVDIATGEIISRETFEYHGPVAYAISGSGSKSKSKSQSQSQSESQSGTQFNADFLNRAIDWASNAGAAGKRLITNQQGPFDTARYLKENPDVAADPVFSKDPWRHYVEYGQSEGRAYPGEVGGTAEVNNPTYDPTYVKGAYTPGAFTPVDGGDFAKIEQNLYGSSQSKLAQAYNQEIARQREELSQAGALNSPSQYLEGSARSSTDRSYLQNLQQAARDASTYTLGLKASEAGRRTAFDVGQGQARTAYDVGEAGRETTFNESTASALLDAWFKKLAMAIDSGRYSTGESSATSYGTSSGLSGSGGIGRTTS